MAKVKNLLFIMCDQLRWDYLSCAGHPHIETPHIDALAAKGVRFTQAYCQSAVCGPSRMSFYTGRYMFSHGANWNAVPLSVREKTMGDHLRPHGLRVALAGKTHMQIDTEGMDRLKIDPVSEHGVLITQCGFEPYDRDDGLHSPSYGTNNDPYQNWLRELGYDGETPWHDWANSAEGPNGEILSGWEMRHARLPARIKEEHSETPFMTNRAMAFMEECGDEQPWCLHLSYIKPHWPYVAPAPYHAMYDTEHVIPAIRTERERQSSHPVYAAFQQHQDSQSWSRQETRETVIPTYMGLIKQIDDQLGRLFAFMEEQGLMDNTMIVFTADHGDYLGDHWLGEKELFHDTVCRLPFIVYDPDPAADATRGTNDDRMVEAIDVLPTFLDAITGETESESHWLEGRSLVPLLRGEPTEDWRAAIFNEADYAYRGARTTLGLEPHQCRAFMVRTADWKYVLYEGFRPQIFDLKNDPDELTDLGDGQAPPEVEQQMREMIFDWLRTRRLRTTRSEAQVKERAGQSGKRGIVIGHW